MGWLGAGLSAGVDTFARVDVSFVDVKMEVPHRGCEWRHAPEACAEYSGRFEKVSVLSLVFRRRRVTFASSQWPCGECHTCWGRRWKSQHRNMVPLSLCRKTFKLKGNKKFRTWTKKSSIFRVSGFLCSMYICYEHSMYVSIFLYGYVTIWTYN